MTSTMYRGQVDTTVSGKTCQAWTDQEPHEHTKTPKNWPEAGLGEHNYCRNPNGMDYTWCYTTDPNTRWEECDIGKAPELQIRSTMYRGQINTTLNGKTCQAWNEQLPHEHSYTTENYPDAGLGEHNYCRDPDGDKFVWCYTTDPNTRWEECDISDDDSVIDDLVIDDLVVFVYSDDEALYKAFGWFRTFR